MIHTRKLILLIFLSAGLLISDKLKLLEFVKSPLEDAVIPVQKNIFLSILWIKTFPINVGYYLKLGQNLDQIRSLKQKETELELRLALLTEENAILRQQLGATLPPTFDFIPAAVIALSDDMHLNIGQKDGVGEGMPVVVEDYLIGVIESAQVNRSRVKVLTDREIHIPAKTNRGTRGVVSGGGPGSTYFEKVLQKEALFIDDLVVTSGEGGFAPNLILGKIKHITSDDVQVYKSSLVEPGVNISLLTTVFVVKSI